MSFFFSRADGVKGEIWGPSTKSSRYFGWYLLASFNLIWILTTFTYGFGRKTARLQSKYYIGMRRRPNMFWKLGLWPRRKPQRRSKHKHFLWDDFLTELRRFSSTDFQPERGLDCLTLRFPHGPYLHFQRPFSASVLPSWSLYVIIPTGIQFWPITVSLPPTTYSTEFRCPKSSVPPRCVSFFLKKKRPTFCN